MAKRQQNRGAGDDGRGVKSADQNRKDAVADKPPAIRINSHRALAAKQAEIIGRLQSRPEIAALFLVNPSLALQDLGVELSAEMSHHVLETVRHPPGLTKRREQLERKLEKKLGEPPRPNDAKWLSGILFDKLKLQPVSTRGLRPHYRDPLDEATRKRLEARRPKERGNRYTERRRTKSPVLRVKRTAEALRRMDLDAKLPPLKETSYRPKNVSLEKAYFYKDSHPLVRDLLELGIIQKRAFPIRSGAAYRKLKEGAKHNDFRAWIRAVKFNPEQPK